MLSHVFVLTVTLPDGQGRVSASPWVLTMPRGASVIAIPCKGDPQLTGRTGTNRMEARCQLSSESVVVVVGNYVGCSWIYEVFCPSACTSGFTTRVKARSPPKSLQSNRLAKKHIPVLVRISWMVAAAPDFKPAGEYRRRAGGRKRAWAQ